jgi:AcrR family transcriptional regulator
MTRLAADRDTHLTREEIAAEALRQFDERGREPSIRSLAAELRVAPTAIYHHFPSQAAIYQAVVELVWAEATLDLLAMVPRPLEADPIEVLVASGVATRRAWVHHYLVARYMTATPEANEFMSSSLGLMANVFERLGLEGKDAATAFHSFAVYAFGGTLFAAARLEANARLDSQTAREHRPYRPKGKAQARTALSIAEVPDLSVVDPAHDEELFEQGLRKLVEGFAVGRRPRITGSGRKGT